MKSINLKQHAHQIAEQVCKPVWDYAVPFNHQSITVILPDKEIARHNDYMHAIILSDRLAKELFTYANYASLVRAHPLLRWAVASTDDEEISSGIAGSLCGVSVFTNSELDNVLLHSKYCATRITLKVVDGEATFVESKTIHVNPAFSDEEVKRVDDWKAAQAERDAERAREHIRLAIKRAEERVGLKFEADEEIPMNDGETSSDFVKRCEEILRERLLKKTANHGEGETIELRVPGAPVFVEGDKTSDHPENRRLAPEIVTSETYLSMYERYAESEKRRTGSWPRILMVSTGDAIGLMQTANVIGTHLAHAEWKDGTDSRLFLHVNDEMFEQWALDALEFARFAGEIGVVLHNEKDYPYRAVDFAGVKYVSQTFKYVPGSKAKPQRVFTFSYATKTETVM